MTTHPHDPRLWIAVLCLTTLITTASFEARPALGSAPGGPPGKVLLLYSVGGVLTEDGTLWQYRPDRKIWMTIDEAFADQKRETHILPLPVAAADIAEIETFGFLRTRAGELWLYDLDGDRWLKVPPPGRR